MAAAAAAAGATAIASRAASLAADDSPPGWIDAHSHIWTPDVERYPLHPPSTKADLAPPSFTGDELLALATPLGVARVVLIQHHIYHGFDNTYLIDETARHPDRFRVVGMVDDTNPEADQRMRELLPQKVTSFRITPWIQGDDRWLDTPGMPGMWRCAAETRQALGCLVDPKNLPQIDRMCGRFPETPVVIDHFARIGTDGMIRAEDVKQLCRLARHPQVRVKISAYYALGKKQPPYRDLIPMIRQLLECYGAERLMWASDAPYQVQEPHSYAASLQLVTEGLDFLSDDDRQWLLRKTAEKTYFYV